MSTSPHTHIYRLLVILIIGGAGFFWVKGFFVPDSWDSELFYRVDTLEELKEQPLRHGGNEACASSGCHENQQQTSHQDRFDALSRGEHKGLACENCHGPMSLHARDGKKVDQAQVNKKGQLCLDCHAKLITRPKNHPQFDIDNIVGHWYFDVEKDTVCQECHDPHEPRYMAVTKAQGGETNKEE